MPVSKNILVTHKRQALICRRSVSNPKYQLTVLAKGTLVKRDSTLKGTNW